MTSDTIARHDQQQWAYTSQRFAVVYPLCSLSTYTPDAPCIQQEALLPQTDRATRYVSQNLAGLPWGGISIPIPTPYPWGSPDPQQIKVTELEGYS